MFHSQNRGIAGSLEEFANILPNPFYWLDLNQYYLGFNSCGIQATGRNSFEKDFLGKTPLDLYPKEMADQIILHHKEVIKRRRTLCVEETIQDYRTKKIKFLSATIAPLYGEKQEIIGTCGISIDITKAKEAEQALKVAKEKAEKSNYAKTEFIANLSHDVKTPLSGITGLLTVLAKEQTDPENRKLMKDVAAAGQQLQEFFNNCIYLAKNEQFNLVGISEIFNLKQTVDDVCTLYRAKEKQSQLNFSVHYDDNISQHLLGSAPAVYRIIQNLLGNAFKFTKKGAIKLSVTLGEQSTDQRAIIKISVQDTGIGIAKDKQKMIFEKFARAIPSYKGLYNGYGMGLYLVKELVSGLNGQIHLDSTEGRGSTFTVVLPFGISLLNAKEYKAIQHNSLLDTTQKQQKATHKKPDQMVKILIVEDSPIAISVIKKLIAGLSYQFDFVTTGEQAVIAAKNQDYSLIYLDIGLPDMDGYEVTRKIRDYEITQDLSPVPIIAITAHGAVDVKQFCHDAGMTGIFEKPLLAEKIEQSIQRFVYNSPVNVTDLCLLPHLP